MVRSCVSAVGFAGEAAFTVVFKGGMVGALATAGVELGPGVAGALTAGWFSCGGRVGAFGPKNLAQSRITPIESNDATRMRSSGVNLSFGPSGGNGFIGGVLPNAPPLVLAGVSRSTP